MSMSTSVVGFRLADDKWKKMKNIWDICKEAEIEPPNEVIKFFDNEYPGDEPGKEVNIEMATREWSDEYRHGFEVNIKELPDDIYYIWFYNSW